MYIRTRLALWFMLILATMLGAFSVTIYQVTRNSLLGEIDRDVRQRAAAIALTARPLDGTTGLRVPDLDVFTAPDTYLEVLDTRGAVVARSGNLGTRVLPLSRAAMAADRVDEVRIGGLVLMVYARPVVTVAGIQGYVVVARAPRTVYEAVDRLRSVLYPGAILALLLAGLAVWLLTRRAIRPLEDLAGTAAAIAAARDHTRRLAGPRTSNEIGRLSMTINSMLQALEDAYLQLQTLNDLQRQFLADVSHELRTPLTTMLSSLDLVEKVGASDPDFQARALADMRVEADRMARMVTQLLLLARTDAGAALAREPLLLVDVLTDICRQFAPTEGKATLTCHELDSLEGAVVMSNRDYLTQLFLILLDNAFKYTPADGSITISVTLQDETALVSVADTGVGMSARDLPRIFERFYRGANARGARGMGLGLAIAQRLAEAHKGSVMVQSKEGHGSRFIVTLPLLNAASLREEAPVGPSFAMTPDGADSEQAGSSAPRDHGASGARESAGIDGHPAWDGKS
jgi:two-component system, OmpR family, sensor kinase